MDYSGYTVEINESILSYNQPLFFFDLSNGSFTTTKNNNGIELSNDLLGKIFAIKNQAIEFNNLDLSKKEFFTLINLFQKYIKEHTDKNIFWDSLRILL